jgi:CP family cyanate transporter-like MFS transporter
MAGAALAAATAEPLFTRLDLKPTLAIAGLCASCPDILAVMGQAPPGRKNGVRRGDIIVIQDMAVIAFGIGTGAYTLVLAWLPLSISRRAGAHGAAALCWPGLR